MTVTLVLAYCAMGFVFVGFGIVVWREARRSLKADYEALDREHEATQQQLKHCQSIADIYAQSNRLTRQVNATLLALIDRRHRVEFERNNVVPLRTGRRHCP